MIRAFWESSVGKKAVMAVTGVILVAYLLTHVLANLLVFEGPTRINAYAAMLQMAFDAEGDLARAVQQRADQLVVRAQRHLGSAAAVFDAPVEYLSRGRGHARRGYLEERWPHLPVVNDVEETVSPRDVCIAATVVRHDERAWIEVRRDRRQVRADAALTPDLRFESPRRSLLLHRLYDRISPVKVTNFDYPHRGGQSKMHMMEHGREYRGP